MYLLHAAAARVKLVRPTTLKIARTSTYWKEKKKRVMGLLRSFRSKTKSSKKAMSSFTRLLRRIRVTQ
jgi:hypothetical protein